MYGVGENSREIPEAESAGTTQRYARRGHTDLGHGGSRAVKRRDWNTSKSTLQLAGVHTFSVSHKLMMQSRSINTVISSTRSCIP